MRDLSTINYFDPAEQLVQILCQKTQNNNPLFFRILVSYYFAKIASMMRCDIKTHDRGIIPINMYAINLAPSGQGKGHSTSILEDQVLARFKEAFLTDTFPKIAEENLHKLAINRSSRKATDQQVELEKIQKEFERAGTLAFSFDSGTTAAVKQMRHKLLMAGAGSMNLEIDEIGSNLLGNTEVLNTYLELYDIGKVKQKLTKHTNDNIRGEEIDGRTPANMMLYGTPIKLFDGAKTEAELLSFLETGYARRALFGFTNGSCINKELTAEQIYDMLTNKDSNTYLHQLSFKLAALGNKVNFKRELLMTKEVSVELIKYRMHCEERAESLPDYAETRRAEMCHRYFKALKLAGTYAFIDGSADVTEELLYNAIKLVEESGEAFKNLLAREQNYVKIARYIATIDKDVTYSDIIEDMPCYKGTVAQKQELIILATAWGYRNNIIIKKIMSDGVEFLRGESLKETNLDEIYISYSNDIVRNYRFEKVKFDDLHKLTQINNYNWVTHELQQQYRTEDNAVPGFNLVVLDIDKGVDISTAQLLLKEFTYLIYTTKSHTKSQNRFRIVLPMSHTLKLDAKEFKEFMANVYDWLPFTVDDQTNQRARKWASWKGTHAYNKGELLDSLLFIPKTTKNDQIKKVINTQHSMNNLERWFINNTALGNRSNQLIKYALMLVDTGMEIDSIRNSVLALNSKLPEPMEETEILTTILVSATRAITKRNT
jgi:hypothetical protein